MASINITKDQFADMAISFLLDSMVDDTVIPNNDEFRDVIELMKKRGLKSHFLHYYLNTDPMIRVRYKAIKPAFKDEAKGNYTIHIKKDSKSSKNKGKDKEKETLIKRIVKSSIKMIKSHKLRYGNLIAEETVDKIIDKNIKKESL